MLLPGGEFSATEWSSVAFVNSGGVLVEVCACAMLLEISTKNAKRNNARVARPKLVGLTVGGRQQHPGHRSLTLVTAACGLLRPPTSGRTSIDTLRDIAVAIIQTKRQGHDHAELIKQMKWKITQFCSEHIIFARRLQMKDA